MSLRSILEIIQEKLRKREEAREIVQRDMRRAIRLAKRSIFFTHQENHEGAKVFLEEAGELFARIQEETKDHPDLYHSGLVNAAFEEFAEAYTLLTLIQENRFVDPEEIGAPILSYLLSLGDVVGELRRRALDSIRKGEMETAERCLRLMELIYSELIDMKDGQLNVSGLRRKCDVARNLIEITRGDVTIESRRIALEKSILKLEETIRKKEVNN